MRNGELVRRYRSDDAPDMSPEERARELIPAYWLEPPRVLPAAAACTASSGTCAMPPR